METFDAAMLRVEAEGSLLSDTREVTQANDAGKVLIFEAGRYLFCFNFHPSESYPYYHLGLNTPGEYRCVLDTDAREFGGHGRLEAGASHGTWDEPRDGKPHSLCVYAPACTAQVYECVAMWDSYSETSAADGYIEEDFY